jgi:DNA-binding NtrC family response regulator
MEFEPVAKSKNVQLKFSNEEDGFFSYFDADKLDKIFTNLLSNAMKSTKANGIVEITVVKPKIGKEAPKKAKRGEIRREEMIKIKVSDTGSGIPEKDLPFIFDRFRRVENTAIEVTDGSGVGLSLVKDCIEIHHGEIKVESQMGKGTHFTVFLPWAKEHFIPEEIEEKDSISENTETSIGLVEDSNQKTKIKYGANKEPDSEIYMLLNRHSGSIHDETVKIKRIQGSYPEQPILIVDDEIDILESYKIKLKENGIDNIILCIDGNEVLPILKKEESSIIMLDLSLPGISGKKILAEIKENYPNIHVLVVTGLKDVDSAVECIKLGAFDYMVKPVELSRLISNLHHCIEKIELEKEINVLSHKIKSMKLRKPEAFFEIITNNEVMLSKFRYIEAIAESSNPVLITGESGVGKELVARVIHKLSNRKGKFVSENIAGLDDTMITDTLFGHVKGAFTDAEVVRKGLAEEARGGTLFLDEIGDMSINSQVKLLRFIEEKEYRPLGTDKAKVSDSRIIIATNANLTKKLEEGKFRKDLFYRLTYQIHIPPLQERLDDLPYLVNHFIEQTSKALGKKKPTVPKELIVLLRTYSFPGNIRELKNMLENALSRNKSRVLSLSYFREYIQNSSDKNINKDTNVDLVGKQIVFSGEFPTMKEIEDFFVTEALRRTKGNQNVAAKLLGLSPSALSRRLKKRGGK